MKEVKQKIHEIITILALLTSFAACRRVAAAGGWFREPSSRAIIFGSFVSAAPLTPSISRPSSSSDASSTDKISGKSSSSATADNDMTSESCNASEDDQRDLMSSKTIHPDDPGLWLYHVETTTSTMDAAKSIVAEKKFTDGDHLDIPTSFLISASSQSNGRGTTQRKWKSSQRGNALFTIGIPQSSWMNDLKSKNDGSVVPLTLLPLKVGSLVAFHIQRALEECAAKSGETQHVMPRATVKWPNDVLLHSSPSNTHEKIAGILIESAEDWFLIGIGINVGYAPSIPTEGADYGRRASCLSQYCNAPTSEGAVDTDGSVTEEEHWIKVSKQLATDIAYDLHSWLHPVTSPPPNNLHSGESILNQWKSYVDWNMELTLRDTPKRERVTLKDVLDDGRVVVQEVETGLTRTLVSDYFF